MHSTHPPVSPGRMRPSGSGDGFSPMVRNCSTIRAIVGACGTGGCGNAPRGGSVGSAPSSVRAPGRAARRARSTAPASRSRWATPATRRPRVRWRQNLVVAAGTARCPRTWSCRRRCSACTARTGGRARRASVRSCGSAGLARPPAGSQLAGSCGTKSPRSSTEDASARVGQRVHHRAAAGAGSDDDDVVAVVRHR